MEIEVEPANPIIHDRIQTSALRGTSSAILLPFYPPSLPLVAVASRKVGEVAVKRGYRSFHDASRNGNFVYAGEK